MADEVGGIGVSFTADAGQLRTELERLEERLRAFDSAHGRKTIQLQASLVMPGNRALADFRRDISRNFTAQGSAGLVKARVDLAMPAKAAINTFRRELETELNARPMRVTVKGVWGGWEKAPPETVSGRGGGGTPTPAGTTKTITQKPAAAVAASPAARPPRTSGSAEQKAKTFFRDWSNKDLLEEAGAPQTSREYTAMLNLELRRRNLQQGSSGGARGLTGGMTGAFGYGPPSVRHWGQGPVSAVPSGPAVAAMGRRGQLDLPIRDLYDPYAKRPKARLGIRDLPDLTEERLAQRLRTIMSRVTPEAMAAGTGWYQRAGQITQGIGANTGLGRPQIAAATAAFSQQAGWAENLRNAQDFFEAFRRGARTVSEVEREVASIRKNLSFNALGLTGRTQQALDLAQSADPESALAGPKGDRNPKIRAFYRALMGDPTSFTVDRHMAMMMAGSEISSGVGQRVHTPFQRAGQKVAGEMGMSAADLQAIVWTLALGPKFAGADPYRQSVGGARGFAGQDPYQLAMLRQQRESMRAANAAKIRPTADQGADNYTRLRPLSDEQVEARNARLGQILGGGGARGYASLPDPYATPYGREMRARAQGEFDTLTSEYGLRGADLRFRRHSAWDERELRQGRPALDAYAFVSGPARGRVSLGGGLFDERTAAAIPSWRDRRAAQVPVSSKFWPYQHKPRVNVGVESGIEGIVRHELGHLLRERMEASAQAGLTDLGTGVLEISQRAFNRPPSLRAREDPRGHEAFAEAFAEYVGGGMDRWGIEDLLREARGLLPAYSRAMPRGRAAPGQMGLPFGVTGGARGYTGELTWNERLRNMRARPADQEWGPGNPLVLNTKTGRFSPDEADVPVEQVDPRRLLPFRELDRERSPRLQPRRFQSVNESAQYGRDYLDRLTQQLKEEGIREPLRLEYDARGFAQLADGNHRLAAAIRLGLQHVPVQAFPARGELTGNTGRVATAGANTAAGIVGGARGFSTGEFAARGESGLPGAPAYSARSAASLGFALGRVPGMGWEAGNVSARLEEAAGVNPSREMAARVSQPWGGFTWDPRTRQFMEADPSRRRGPYISRAPGTTTESLPLGANPRQVEEALSRQRARPENAAALAAGATIGGFRDEALGRIDLDVNRIDQTAREARRTQRELGLEARGAYDVATGQGVFARPSDRLRQSIREAGQQVAADIAAGGAVSLPHERIAARAPIAQSPAIAQAAEPGRFEPTEAELERMIRANPALADRLGLGGDGGGRGTPPAPPGDPPEPPEDGKDAVGRPTPSQRLLQRAGLEGGTAGARVDDLLKRSREAIAIARGTGQVRAVGTTTGGLIANLFGGKAQRELVARDLGTLRSALIALADPATETGQALAKYQIAQEALAAATLAGRPAEEIESLSEALNKAAEEAKPATEQVDAIGKKMTELEKKISGPKQAAIGLASSISGTIIGLGIFSAANAAVTKTIDGVAAVLERPIDVLTDYRQSTDAVSGGLADLVRQQRGHADLALASTFAQAGLGNAVAGQIGPILEERSAIEAGNKAFEEQIKLIRASIGAQTQLERARRGESYGPGIQPGAIPGITGTTGGFWGTPIGGQAPFYEQLLQNTGAFGTPGQQVLMGAQGLTAGLSVGAGGGSLVGAALGTALLGPGPGTIIGGLVGGGLGGALGGGLLGPALAEEQRPDQGLLPSGRTAAEFLAARPEDLTAGKPAFGDIFTFGAGTPGAALFGESSQNPWGLTQEQVDKITKSLGMFEAATDSANEAAVRAAGGARDVAQGYMLTAETAERLGMTEQQRQAALDGTLKALEEAGASKDQLNAARANSFALLDREGRAVGARGAEEYARQAARGSAMPTPELAVQEAALPLSAQLQLQAWQGQLQRETAIPGQQYLSGLASGRLEPGGERRSFGVSGLPRDVAREAPSFRALNAEITTSQQNLEGVQQSGRAALLELVQMADVRFSGLRGDTSSLTDQFLSLEQNIAQVGGRIRELQLANMWESAQLQADQYTEQIRLAGIQLADLISFTTGAPGGELGLLQRQARAYEVMSAQLQFQSGALGIRSQELQLQTSELQLQSQELGFQATQLNLIQRQRQINFQRSLAGFVTAGDTPEQIAARAREAKLEADFAQQQQNIAEEQFELEKQAHTLAAQQLPIQAQQLEIAKQQLEISKGAFGVQQAMIDVNAARAIEALVNQIDLMTRARTLTLDIAIRNEAIENLQAELEGYNAQMQSVIDEAYGAQQTYMTRAASFVAQYGGLLTTWNNRLITGLNNYLREAGIAMSNYIESFGDRVSRTGGGGYIPEGTGGGPRYGGAAAGFFSSVTGPMQMTVGEAGPETIAILRNPRNLTLGPGSMNTGGGTVVNVTVTGNNIGGSQQDAEEFAAIIARRVEETMSRRGSLLGMRSNN